MTVLILAFFLAEFGVTEYTGAYSDPQVQFILGRPLAAEGDMVRIGCQAPPNTSVGDIVGLDIVFIPVADKTARVTKLRGVLLKDYLERYLDAPAVGGTLVSPVIARRVHTLVTASCQNAGWYYCQARFYLSGDSGPQGSAKSDSERLVVNVSLETPIMEMRTFPTAVYLQEDLEIFCKASVDTRIQMVWGWTAHNATTSWEVGGDGVGRKDHPDFTAGGDPDRRDCRKNHSSSIFFRPLQVRHLGARYTCRALNSNGTTLASATYDKLASETNITVRIRMKTGEKTRTALARPSAADAVTPIYAVAFLGMAVVLSLL